MRSTRLRRPRPRAAFRGYDLEAICALGSRVRAPAEAEVPITATTCRGTGLTAVRVALAQRRQSEVVEKAATTAAATPIGSRSRQRLTRPRCAASSTIVGRLIHFAGSGTSA